MQIAVNMDVKTVEEGTTVLTTLSGIVGGINLVIGVGLYFRYSCNFQSRSMVQCNRTAGTLISP
jgi:hypothetical protein